MSLRLLRLVAVMLTALSMGTALCHLLEMPAKLKLDGKNWLFLLQNVYPIAFGTFGAFFEVGAIVATVILAVMTYRRRPAFFLTVLSVTFLLAAHSIFWIWVAPVNAALGSVTAESLPADWASLRSQWEYSHAARAILQIFALGTLVYSLLLEIPGKPISLRMTTLPPES